MRLVFLFLLLVGCCRLKPNKPEVATPLGTSIKVVAATFRHIGKDEVACDIFKGVKKDTPIQTDGPGPTGIHAFEQADGNVLVCWDKDEMEARIRAIKKGKRR